jgi:non-ribosomal peptide synthetase component E (peptide arylation enzyme)
VADDSRIRRPAFGLDRVQRRDDDDAAGVRLGATFVIERAFDPEAVIATIERERVTHTMLVPSQIIAILNAKVSTPARLASLEMILSLGAPLHQESRID